MSSFFAGGLLILLLQLPIVLRPLFFKKPRIDSIVMFLPFSLIIMALYFFAFGARFYSIQLLLLVLLVFFTNFRAMLRFKNKLFIDHYSFLFCAASFLEFIAIIGMIVQLILFCPVSDMELSLNFDSKPDITVKKTMYTGSAYRGMTERESIFDPVNAILYTYEPENADTSKVILCVGGCCADPSDYAPLLKNLMKDGYTSLILESNADDIRFTSEFWNSTFFRPFMMRVIYKNDSERYKKLSEEFYNKKIIEAQVLIDIAKKQYPDSTFYLLTDDFPAGIVESTFPDYTNIFLELDGCGLIALTKPLEASLVHPERWGRKNREESFMLPERLSEYIKKIVGN